MLQDSTEIWGIDEMVEVLASLDADADEEDLAVGLCKEIVSASSHVRMSQTSNRERPENSRTTRTVTSQTRLVRGPAPSTRDVD